MTSFLPHARRLALVIAAVLLPGCSGLVRAVNAAASQNSIDGVVCRSGMGSISGAGVTGSYALVRPDTCVGDSSISALLAPPTAVPAYVPTAPAAVHLYLDGTLKSEGIAIDLQLLTLSLPTSVLGNATHFELFAFGYSPNVSPPDVWTDTGLSATVSNGSITYDSSNSVPFLSGGSKSGQRLALAIVGDK